MKAINEAGFTKVGLITTKKGSEADAASAWRGTG